MPIRLSFGMSLLSSLYNQCYNFEAAALSCVQLRATRDTRHATATATLFATHVFLCMCSVRRDKQQVARDVSPATFGIVTCSDPWRDFLEVARHCDIICTKYRSLTWILRCPSLRIAIFGWTVHDLLFKRFAKGWQLIQQGDIDVPRVCLYWCRGWNFHHRFLFDLRCTGT